MCYVRLIYIHTPCINIKIFIKLFLFASWEPVPGLTRDRRATTHNICFLPALIKYLDSFDLEQDDWETESIFSVEPDQKETPRS